MLCERFPFADQISGINVKDSSTLGGCPDVLSGTEETGRHCRNPWYPESDGCHDTSDSAACFAGEVSGRLIFILSRYDSVVMAILIMSHNILFPKNEKILILGNRNTIMGSRW